MSDWLVGFMILVYALASCGYFCEGKAGLGVAFAAYALGNVGLILASRGH